MIARIRNAIAAGRPSGAGYGYSSLTGGGVVNHVSGAGTMIDKSEAAFFTPTRIYTRYPFEIIYAQSWAARKAIDLPVRDMFLRSRRFKGSTPEAAAEIEKAFVSVDSGIRRAMCAGRLYGTALMVLITGEAPLEEPLVPERIRPGDLKAIRVFNRYDCSALARDYDLASETYGKPLLYSVSPNYGGLPIRVHASRCIRFEGQRNPDDVGYTAYEQDWGLSVLIPVMQSIMQEATISQATAHMVSEASVPVLHVTGLRDTLAGKNPDEASADTIGAGVNQLKSIYRLLMLDKGNEDFTRVAVQFSGIADLIDRSCRRVAAAVDIPFSRFMQDVPRGMNATGDGDFRNYVMTFESERQHILPPVYDMIDEVVYRSMGFGDLLEYEWPSLIELTEAEQTEQTLNEVQALEVAITAGIIDEDEARAALDGNAVFGELPGDAPGLPDPEIPPAPAGPPSNGD